MTEDEARDALCRTGRRLYRSGLVGGTAGNFSLRMRTGGGDRLLVTPRSAHKGRLSPEELVLLPLADPPEDAVSRATSELPLHRAVAAAAPAVAAVLHTHAPCLTALGLREMTMDEDLPEVEEAVGPVRTLPFAPSGSRELGAAAATAVREGAAVLVLRRHGAVAVGRDLEEAENRMELAELSARTVLLARS